MLTPDKHIKLNNLIVISFTVTGISVITNITIWLLKYVILDIVTLFVLKIYDSKALILGTGQRREIRRMTFRKIFSVDLST